MLTIDSYIVEKLRINKNTKISLRNPKTKDDIKAMIETYFWEWFDNDEIFKVPKSASKEDMEKVYDHIIKACDESTYRIDKFIRDVVPAAFRKYMNKNYGLNIDERM